MALTVMTIFFIDSNEESSILKRYSSIIQCKRKVKVNENTVTGDSVDALTTINWGQTQVPKYL